MQHNTVYLNSRSETRIRERWCIGEITLELAQGHNSTRYRMRKSYSDFAESDRKADLLLNVRRQDPPVTDIGCSIYDLGFLSHYRTDRGFIWRQPGKTQQEVADRIVILDDDLNSGEIWVQQTPAERTEPALYHPLDAVIINHILVQKREGITLHAAGIKDYQHGILFVGFSGAGKSTMSGIWKKQAGADLLCDDRIIVRKKGDRMWMYSTPWHSSEATVKNIAMPVESVFIIKHGTQNEAKLLDPAVAVSQLMARSFLPYWDEKGSTAVTLLSGK